MHLPASTGLERLPNITRSSRRSARVSAAPLPAPHIYELEYRYWPWGDLIEWTAAWVAKTAPQDARIFDYMCGTGFLLSKIQELRPDVELVGCDIHEPFVRFAKANHSNIEVHHADALTFVPNDQSDVILCTAGLHHLTFEQQSFFLQKLVNETSCNTILVLGEEAIHEYSDETSRRLSALRFNADLIAHGLAQHWPSDMIDLAIEVMKNDVMSRGEYKRSITEWKKIIAVNFEISQTQTIWAPPAGGGDILFVCRRSRDSNEL